MRAAAMARAAATRQAWEVRTLRFLADGNAVLTDGTEIKIWVAVQQEIAEAETKGVPLSDQARAALFRARSPRFSSEPTRRPRRSNGCPSGPTRESSCGASCQRPT